MTEIIKVTMANISNISSSGYYGTSKPENLFDGNVSTLWNSYENDSKGNTYVTIRLKRKGYLNSIKIAGVTLISSGAFGVRDFQISGSNNGVDFDILYTGTHPNNNSTLEATISSTTKYEYLKFESLNSYFSTTKRVLFGELEYTITVNSSKSLLEKDGVFYSIENSNLLYSTNKDNVELKSITLPLNVNQNIISIKNLDSGISIPVNKTLKQYLLDSHDGLFDIFNCTDDLDLKSNQVLINRNPQPQLVYPISDISLMGIESIDKLTLLSTGNTKIAISFDSGVTWNAYKNGIWETVANAHSGMTNLELNALTTQQIELARNGSPNIRFNYSLSDNAEVDNIEVKVSLQGTEKIASTNDFGISYDETTNKIIYNIKRASSYSVNYVDS